MKYNLTKKISYSIIILVLLVGLSLTAIFGMNGKGYGSAKDINLGLDLAGGVSITYEIKEDNPSSQDIEDTIYKLEKTLERKYGLKDVIVVENSSLDTRQESLNKMYEKAALYLSMFFTVWIR